MAQVSSQTAKLVVYDDGGGEVTIPRSLVDHIEKSALPSGDAPAEKTSTRAISPSDLPLPAATAAQPAAAESLAITDNAVDQDKLNHLDDAFVKNPAPENRIRLSQGYQAAAEFDVSQGHPQAGLDLYRHATKLAPDDLGLTLGMAYLLIRETHYNEAIEMLLPAETSHPKSADVPLLLGSAYYALEDLDRAIEEWKGALALHASEPLRAALAKAEKEKEASSAFQEIRSSHFLLRYDDRQAKGLGESILAALEDAFHDLQVDLDYYPQETIVVLVYSQEAFHDITQAPDWAGGVNDGKIRVPASGLTGATPTLTHLLKHELTHSFVHLITQDRCPTWFNEGLAQLEEGKNTAGQGSQLAHDFAAGRLPAFSALQDSFLKLPADQATSAYAKSLAGLEYLRDVYGMTEVRILLKDMASNPDVNALLEQDLRLNYASLEQEVAAYMVKKYGT